MSVVAHLNGGPYDDTLFATEAPLIRVTQLGRPAWALDGPERYTAPMETRQGSYAPRHDAFGDLVPHDLTGIAEWDWQGWWNE